MPAKLIGAHVSIKDGLGEAVRRGHAMGCTAIQVFTSSPRQWYSRPVSDAQVADFRAAKAETGLTAVVSHDSYLINLCAPTPEIAEKSFAGLKGEIERCDRYGIDRVVSHIASYKGQDQGETLVLVAERLKEMLKETPESVTLLMETTAGQGSSINSRFEEIAILLDLTGGPKRLGVCLDTCHIFAAGYDIRTEETYEASFAEFGRLVGFDRLMAIHCNDSMKPFASRLDRHADIGDGEIGTTAFKLLVNDSRFENIPILLETEDLKHEMNLSRLQSYLISADSI
ncbi:MAG: deoxyribonuclease IV [Fimbriimonadaceae bacterium]